MMRSAGGAMSFAREYYVDAELFRRECEQLFARHWMMLGRTDDLLPRDSRAGTSLCALNHLGMPIVLSRDENQPIRAFHNVCRHRGALMVSQGCSRSETGLITCPYHAWKYDCQGRLIGVPNMHDVDNFDRQEYGLINVEVEEKGGFVFARLHPGGESIDQWLEPLARHCDLWSLDELTVAREIQYDLKANWKLLFENYNECYHCPIIHPALNRLTPYRTAENDLTEGHILGGPMSLAEGIESMSHDGSRGGEFLPKLDAVERRRVYYFTVFPSFFLSLHPDFVMVHRLEPISVDRTRVCCQFLFHRESLGRPDFAPDGVVEFWHQTNVQDWDVCERVQAGAQSPFFRSGPLSNLESVVAAFDQYYLSAMQNAGVAVASAGNGPKPNGSM